MTGFTPWRLAARGLRGHRRSHAAVAAGVAVATAVLVGALVVGESVRGSLRGLVEERLGRIDTALAPGRTFRAELADEADAAPLLLTPASVSHRADGKTVRASGVTLIGCDGRFFALDAQGADAWPESFDGALVTEAVAEELGVAAGDDIVLRSGVAAALPADSPLGEKSDTVASTRVTVAGVVPPRGLARFALAPSQGEPRNVFVPLAVAQRLIDAPDEANALVASGELTIEPKLADYGLTLEKINDDAWQLESRELVLPAPVVEAVGSAWADRPRVAVSTYLANTIRVGDRSIPYSTVAGVGGDAAVSPVGEVADDQIVLNRWAADDLGAEVGDSVTITFYEPESTHGELTEAPPVTITLAAIAPLVDPEGEPTAANDRRWTPRLEGVTDAESINNWDLPFELTEEIRDADEVYWDEYNTTPKAFVSLATAERLWGSRWGDVSLVRVAAEDASRDDLTGPLRSAIDPTDLGFQPQPIKARGLAAASGSTPFDVLFLLFSMFLIGAALLLIVLLVWLAIDARRREMGVLGAVGFDRRAVRRGLLRELAPVAALGAIVGAAAGVAYAAGLLALLRTVWVAAIGAPFLRLHAGPASILGGAVGAWLVAMLTIYWAVRRATAEPPKSLLAGEASPDGSAPGSVAKWAAAAIPCAVASIGIGAAGGSLRGESAAGAFFGAGALALAALVTGVYALAAANRRRGTRAMSLGSLAALNTLRRPGRAMLTVGLVGAASFLLLATSAFRLPPTEAGTGGYDLVCQTDQPLHYDLASEEGRFELGFGRDEEATLAGAEVEAFRVQPGEDASCRNLYQTSQPRVLGVPERFLTDAADRATPFTWADHAAAEGANPWSVLAPDPDDGAVPVVLDFNTAVYSLKLYGGVGSTFTIRDGTGEPVTVRLAGLLKNSVLQGDLLMGEADFLRLYPSASGYRFFLVDAEEPAEVAAALEDVLSDYGFDAASADDRLAGFLAVQNTYLSTFQALGGLGLALGAVGLAVAQFRNLLERRGELALMRAGGFGKRRLRRLVLRENLTLLVGGLVVGAAATAATLGPLSAQGRARPPWLTAVALVGVTVVIGLVAGRIAAGRALAAPVTSALRGE